MAAMLTLAFLQLGCSWKEPKSGNEGIEPIQLGKRGWVFSLRFSPDGKYLAVSSEANRLPRFAVWEVGSQTEVFTRQGHLHARAFSPDGRTMALSGAFSLDGETIVRGDPVTLWDTTTWKEKPRLAIAGLDSVHVHFLAFHPKENLLFVAGSHRPRNEDGVLLLWDLKAGKARYKKKAQRFGTSAFALSPDGSTLVTGEDTVKVWEAASGKELWSFAANPSREGVTHVACVAFLPDGGTFATGGNDGKVRLWDLKAKKEKAVFSGELYNSRTLAVSPDGKVIVVGGSRTGDAPCLVEFWEVSTGKRLAKLNVPGLHRIALSPDGKWLATGTADDTKKGGPDWLGAVELWKMAEVLRKKSK